MDDPDKHVVGERIRVLVGYRYYSAVVVEVGRWWDRSGNSYPVYKARLESGTEIRCGDNSTLKKGDRWF